MELQATLKKEAQAFGIQLSDEQLDKFRQYFELLVDWNANVNLTSITEPKEVARKHFLDSLLLIKDVNFTQIKTVIDVGTGAGFPGIPLKIYYPDLKLTLLDSLQKRCAFLQEVANQLNLENVTVIHERAEIAAQDPNLRESFDLATARAVANLRVLSEYCLPFVKVGGIFLAPKGKEGETEAQDAKNAIKILGAELAYINYYELPEDAGERKNIVLKKCKTTPSKYPRKAGTPERKPL